MKLNAEKIEVESVGFQSTGFSLEVDDPQIIEILTQKIYTDPHVFPRELMANAIDSGGIYDLVIPDALSPSWEVEDKGAGMSHDFMMTNYTKIFHSTKRKDNNNIGGFGHGRLSPLAYTDSYTVRSRFRGVDGTIMEGNYVVFRGENKVPQITCVSMSKSEVKETGVRVCVPIANRDITLLAEKTQHFGQYFDPCPPGLVAVKYVFKDKNGGLRSIKDADRYNKQNDGPRVVIGGVPYPVPGGLVADSMCADIFVDIGTVDVTLSRDAINNTHEAKKVISEKFDAFREAYAAFLQAQIDAEKTGYERYLKYKQLSSEMGYTCQQYFLKNVKNVTSMPIETVMDAAKKDFAIHVLNSDTSRAAWDGMDEVTKAYRSLSGLRIFMLNSKCEIERRDGRKTTTPIDFRYTFDNAVFDQSGKPTMLFFAVPLPYSTGQIKKIKDGIAQVLADIRKKNPLNNLTCVLIQYEDKADVKAIAEKIISDPKIGYIDIQASTSKLARYISLLEWKGNNSGLKKKALSENVIAAAKDVIYIAKDPTVSESRYGDILSYFQNGFPKRLEGKTVYVVSQTDVKYLPAGSKTLKEVFLEAVAKDYGYDYKSDTFDKDLAAIAEIRRTNGYAVLNYKVKKTNKTLAHYIAQYPGVPADVVTLMGEVETASKGDGAANPHANYKSMLSTITMLVDRYGFVTKSELPAATKTVQTTQVQSGPLNVDKFIERYPLLAPLVGHHDYRYYGYTDEIALAVCKYITKT